MAQAAERFAKLDANGDGQISGDEMKAVMERMREAGGGFGGRRGAAAPAGDMAPPPPPPGAEGGPMGGPRGHHGPHMMDRVDTNHDGRISRDEMRAQADARFDKLDTNHDGFIDKAEMEAAHTKMMACTSTIAAGRWARGRAMPGRATPPHHRRLRAPDRIPASPPWYGRRAGSPRPPGILLRKSDASC